jgi:tRNA nucleotidyltransferase (CCA-adding enzyme)
MANHKSKFTLTIEALQVGESTEISYEGDFVPNNVIYPRITRLRQSLQRTFECQRISPTKFLVRRTA